MASQKWPGKVGGMKDGQLINQKVNALKNSDVQAGESLKAVKYEKGQIKFSKMG